MSIVTSEMLLVACRIVIQAIVQIMSFERRIHDDSFCHAVTITANIVQTLLNLISKTCFPSTVRRPQ